MVSGTETPTRVHTQLRPPLNPGRDVCEAASGSRSVKRGAAYTRNLLRPLRSVSGRTPVEAPSVLHVLNKWELFFLLTDVVETGKKSKQIASSMYRYC